MIRYDWLRPADRPFEPQNPYPGLAPILVDGQRFYAVKPNTGGARDYTTFDTAEARKWPDLCPGAPCIVNIEAFYYEDFHRPVHADIRLSTARQIQDDFTVIRKVIDDVRSSPHMPEVGFYGFLPAGFNVLNSIIKNDSQELQLAQASNDALASIFGDCLDLICPSLYNNTTRWNLWERLATHQVNECRRVSRIIGAQPKIVPFITPEIHPSAGRGLIAPSFWKHQIAFLEALGVDGVVLWLGGTNATWTIVEPYARAAVK